MAGRREARRWLPVLAALAGWLAAPGARAQTPKPVIGTSRAPSQEMAETQRLWLPVFSFRSGFWVNLNHFLYLQARLERGLAASRGGRQPAAPADLSKLTPGERAAWQDAVGYYASRFAGYDLAYDSFLVRVEDRLGDMAACPDLSGRTISTCDAGLAPDLTAVLEEAAPVFRAHWWPAQNAANQAWIAQTRLVVQRYGGPVAERLARIYEATWPPDPIPIDVTNYAGRFGAYTTLDPAHVIVSSSDPRNQGLVALEVIFREASQTLATGVEQSIITQCQSRTKPIPRDLWPALVLYTAGQAVSRALAGRQGRGAADHEKVYAAPDRGYMAARGWQDFEQLLERYWQPYLDGKTDSATAIARLVAAM